MKNSNLKSINLVQKLRPHENKWVALSLDHREVLGTGKNLREAKQKAEKKNKEYVFIKLPPFDVNYIPSF
ncbi:hypothetical protein KJ562_02660 [Patescibacteria group bacterium]|nr:hypothetical protein [Patescibacteria group bacterium]MBU4162218.1 hypothetical protein [Patescibacteria group bacterium]